MVGWSSRNGETPPLDPFGSSGSATVVAGTSAYRSDPTQLTVFPSARSYHSFSMIP